MLRLACLCVLLVACGGDPPEPEPLRPPTCECPIGDACVDGECVGPADRRGCAGNTYGCAIHEGAAWCWGTGPQAHEGDNPIPVRVMPDAVELACATTHVCGRRDDGSVRCWGSNRHGQTGHADHTEMYADARAGSVAGLSGVVQLALSPGRSCARSSDGSVSCWGRALDRDYGQAELDAHEPRSVPLTDTRDIAMFGDRLCAIRADGRVACWGDRRPDPPRVVSAVDNAVELASGTQMCARLDDGHVVCWVREANRVWGLDDARSLTATGQSTMCARRANGQAWCWGANHYGQIGNDSREGRPNPTRVRALAELQLLSGSGELSCAMRDAEVHCWGRNVGRILGLGEVHRMPKHVFTLGSDEQPPIEREFPPASGSDSDSVADPGSEAVPEAVAEAESVTSASAWHCLCYRDGDGAHTACRQDPAQCTTLEQRATRMQRGFTGLDVACRDVGAAQHPSERVGASATWQPSARPGAHWVEGECVLNR